MTTTMPTTGELRLALDDIRVEPLGDLGAKATGEAVGGRPHTAPGIPEGGPLLDLFGRHAGRTGRVLIEPSSGHTPLQHRT